jgi:hypothetical protein
MVHILGAEAKPNSTATITSAVDVTCSKTDIEVNGFRKVLFGLKRGTVQQVPQRNQ